MSASNKSSFFNKLIIPGILGSILEWYDFALYGFLAPILAQLFFPSNSKFLSLLATFGVFAAGFFMRPLGSVIFGHFGDKFGRKKTLASSILLMAIPTTVIGLLPTHAQIGIFAGILLTTCRLLQGFAMSGDLSGSIVYVTEHSPHHYRGFWGSWLVSGCFMGLLLASSISALIGNFLTTQAFNSWGWRIPFLMGALLAIVGFYLRSRMPETAAFLKIKQDNHLTSNPIRSSFKTALKPMSIILGLNFLPATVFYLAFVYLPSYLTTYLHLSLAASLHINSISMLLMIICTPFIGLLSDKVGRKMIFALGAVGFLIFSYPLFRILQQGTFNTALFVQLCFALLTSLVYAPIPAAFAELLPTNLRYTGTSFPHNLGSAIYGGTTPLLMTLLIAKTNNTLSPSFYLIFAAIVMLWVVVKMRGLNSSLTQAANSL